MRMQAESPRLHGARADEPRHHDAPWLVVPVALLAVIVPGLLLIARWSLG